MQTSWTVFFNKPINEKSENTKLYFMVVKQEIFKALDVKNDWRFCAVKNKRNEAVILGDVELNECEFPIKFPLKLSNGIVILNEKVELNNINTIN